MNQDSLSETAKDAAARGPVLRPIIDAASREAVACYFEPALPGRDGGVLTGDDALLDGSGGRALNQKVLAKNTSAVLGSAAMEFNSPEFKGLGLPVIVPLNAAAFVVNHVANAFTKTCRELEEVFSGHIIFEAMNFPEPLTLAAVDDLAILLFPFSDRYLARPHLGAKDFKVFANCNFYGVSLHLQDKPWPVDKVIPHLENFVAKAKANRLPAYLHGAGTGAIVDAALAAGCDFVDGAAID